jgi:hypothetical protein
LYQNRASLSARSRLNPQAHSSCPQNEKKNNAYEIPTIWPYQKLKNDVFHNSIDFSLVTKMKKQKGVTHII